MTSGAQIPRTPPACKHCADAGREPSVTLSFTHDSVEYLAVRILRSGVERTTGPRALFGLKTVRRRPGGYRATVRDAFP